LEKNEIDEETSLTNLNNKLRSSYIVSDSNGTYQNPILIRPCSSLTYLSGNQVAVSQVFRTFNKGQEFLFDSAGGIKNSSVINGNDYYPEFKRVLKTKGDNKMGQDTYTSISGIIDGDLTAFIRNEAAMNERNNFIHTPSAGVLFCSSLGCNKINTSECNFRFGPTSKIVKIHLQSSKGSEATTSKAMTKYQNIEISL
jgi:hypothetical protein